jgi:cytoskeletal protein CcmA (bactofilin family)
MILQWRGCLAVALGILGVSAACSPACVAAETSKVMGNIEVAAGEHSGDVSTVNGSIHIGENAVVGTAHTVNGSIALRSRASATELVTVNGSIDLAQQAKVSGQVRSVNGKLSLADGAAVGGALINVNGAIRVAAAHLGGGIETVSGGIELGPNAQVNGGIHVRRESGTFHLFSEEVPRIVVGPGSVVAGTLNFERKVSLYVSDKAQIGPVQGATAVKYSGERPPD